MVFLGGTPAALIGVLTILAGWLRWRDEPHDLLNNLLTYAIFPLVGGIAFHEVVDARRHHRRRAGLLRAASSPLFQLALAINFAMIAGYGCYLERSSFCEQGPNGADRRCCPPSSPARMMAVGGRLHLPPDRDRRRSRSSASS